MGLLDFLHKPKTKDISYLNIPLFEKYGWVLLDRVDLKKFPVEKYFKDTGLTSGNGGIVCMPVVFKKTVTIDDRYVFDYLIYYEYSDIEERCNWKLSSEGVYDFVRPVEYDEKTLIEIEEYIKNDINISLTELKEQQELVELRNKKISDLTPNELRKLGIKF